MSEADSVNNILFVSKECSFRGFNKCVLSESVTQDLSSLSCLECEGVLRDPIVVQGNNVCATCSGHNATVSNSQLTEAINQLICKCPLQTRGCDWLGELSGLIGHMDECGYLMIRCRLGCETVLLRDEVSEHIDEYCPRKPMECPFDSVGCKVRNLCRDNVSLHMESSLVLHQSLLLSAVAGMRETNLHNRELIVMHGRTIQQHDETVKQNQENISQHGQTINENKQTIEQHNCTIEQHNCTIKQHDETVKQNQENISQHGQTINEHKQTIEEHAKSIVDQRETILLNRDSIVRYGQTVVQQNELIEQYNQTIIQLTEKIENQNKTIEQYDQTITQLTEKIENQNKTIEQYDQTITQQDKKIENQNKTIEQYDQTIIQLTEKIENQNKTIEQYDQTIIQQNEKINLNKQITRENEQTVEEEITNLQEHLTANTNAIISVNTNNKNDIKTLTKELGFIQNITFNKILDTMEWRIPNFLTTNLPENPFFGPSNKVGNIRLRGRMEYGQNRNNISVSVERIADGIFAAQNFSIVFRKLVIVDKNSQSRAYQTKDENGMQLNVGTIRAVVNRNDFLANGFTQGDTFTLKFYFAFS